MGPLVSQLLVPPPQGDPNPPGPGATVVWVPGKVNSVRCCGCGDSGSQPQTNTATYANVNYYYATCQPSDLVGNLVYATGQDNTVSSADASSPLPVIGAIVAKSSATACTVQTFGIITGLYKNLLANTQYFLGHMGQVISTPFDSSIEFVQGIGSSVDSETIYLRPSGSAVRRDTSS